MQEVKQRFETKLESLQKPVDNTGKKDGSSNDEKIVSVYDSLKYELSQDKKQVEAIKPAMGFFHNTSGGCLKQVFLR